MLQQIRVQVVAFSLGKGSTGAGVHLFAKVIKSGQTDHITFAQEFHIAFPLTKFANEAFVKPFT